MTISIRGATEHNLQSVDLDIPSGSLTVICGPSGSGKTSLAFDTLTAFAEHREAMLAEFVGLASANSHPPRVKSIHGLPTVISLRQQHLISTPHTVASFLGIGRELFELSTRSQPDAVQRFCPKCRKPLDTHTPQQVVQSIAALSNHSEVLISAPVKAAIRGFERYIVAGKFAEQPDSKLPSQLVVDRISPGVDSLERIKEAVSTATQIGQGELVAWDHAPLRIESFYLFGHCSGCGWRGGPLRSEQFDFRTAPQDEIALLRWPELPLSCAEFLDSAVSKWSGELCEPRMKHLQRGSHSSPLQSIFARLELLERLGLGYLHLLRPLSTLSSGEYNRVQLAAALANVTAGRAFILDEPTSGLHPKDTQRLVQELKALVANDNTVIVVDHDQTLRQAATFTVELGPGAGRQGGRVIAAQENLPLREFTVSASPTAFTPTGWLELEGATLHNLKDISVRIPLGCIVGVAGVSGSGKSSLVVDTLYPALRESIDGGRSSFRAEHPHLRSLQGYQGLERVVLGRDIKEISNPLSIAATYSGVLDPIRKFLAKLPLAQQHGLTARNFSLAASRFKQFEEAVLEVRYHGLNINDILSLTAEEATQHFAPITPVATALRTLLEFNLGHLVLGQPLTTVSSGELQRLILGRDLRGKRAQVLYIFDEPTRGLDNQEIARLVQIFRKLCASGASFIVIEHNQFFLSQVDHLIELGPGAGADGGEVVSTSWGLR